MDRLHDPRRDPKQPIVTPSFGEIQPLSIEQLTQQSELVVEARIARLRSYIDRTDKVVITDYAVQPLRVLAGHEPANRGISGPNPIVVVVVAGEVVREGVVIRAMNFNHQDLVDGRTYLLFLKHFDRDDAGHYEIFDAAVFEIANGSARPLAASHSRETFKEFVDLPYSDVVARVAQSELRRKSAR
jgi:hypothetical protein